MRRGFILRLRMLALFGVSFALAWVVYREWGRGGLSAVAFAYTGGIMVLLVPLLRGVGRSAESSRVLVRALVVGAAATILAGISTPPGPSRSVPDGIAVLGGVLLPAGIALVALAWWRGRRR